MKIDSFYSKASEEMNELIHKLKHSTPQEVLYEAYRVVIYSDILMIFEEEDFTDEQIEALDEFQYPLSACYDAWLNADCSHMEMLKATIEDFADRGKRN